MKKRKLLFAIFFIAIAIGFFSAITWRSYIANLWSKLPVASPSAVEKTLSYQQQVEEALAQHDLDDFTATILAIIYQESKGKGKDPMQSSESAGLARNEIQNASESIEQGVYHFYQMYVLGKKNGVDMETIIQSYNMGPGYIYFVAENGFQHSESLAKAYSEKQVKRNPELYSCSASGSYRYPYCYGDFSYVAKITSKIAIFEEKMINT